MAHRTIAITPGKFWVREHKQNARQLTIVCGKKHINVDRDEALRLARALEQLVRVLPSEPGATC